MESRLVRWAGCVAEMGKIEINTGHCGKLVEKRLLGRRIGRRVNIAKVELT
jgi:hypothetical protein